MANASYQSRIPQKYQALLAPYVTQSALKYNVPESKIWEQIAVESGGNPNAQSPTGPLGAMQLSTAAAKDAGYTKQEMLDPAKNIDAGTRKLKSDLDYYGGDWNKARLAYNQGRGMANKILSGKAEMNKEASNYINNPIFKAGYLTNQGAATATAEQAATTQDTTQQAIGFASGSRSRWEAAKGAEGGFNPQYLSNNNPSTNTNYWSDRAKGLDTGVSTVKDKNNWADKAIEMMGNLQAQQNQGPQPVQHSQQLAQLMQNNGSAQMFANQPQQATQYNFNQSLATPKNNFQILNNFGGL